MVAPIHDCIDHVFAKKRLGVLAVVFVLGLHRAMDEVLYKHSPGVRTIDMMAVGLYDDLEETAVDGFSSMLNTFPLLSN